MEITDKEYVNRKVARKLRDIRGIKRLPRIGRQIVTVYPTMLGLRDEVMGQDVQGYYTGYARY